MTATLAVLAGVMVVWKVLAWAWLVAVVVTIGAALYGLWRAFVEFRVGVCFVAAIFITCVALSAVSGGCDAHAADTSTRKVVMPSAPATRTQDRSAHNGGAVAPGSSQSVAAAPVVLRFTLPAYQQGAPCADGAPLAWIDSVRAVARKRGPTGPYVSAQWRAYLAQPDTLLAQHAVSWTRIGLPDSFIVAAADTGATGWVQVHGTRGWSSVCRWVKAW